MTSKSILFIGSRGLTTNSGSHPSSFSFSVTFNLREVFFFLLRSLVEFLYPYISPSDILRLGAYTISLTSSTFFSTIFTSTLGASTTTSYMTSVSCGVLFLKKPPKKLDFSSFFAGPAGFDASFYY
jgi:hypothetical protein